MIEPDINERMARFAPSQNVGSQPDPIALEVLAETEADAPPPMAPGFDPIAVQIARESQDEMMATLRGASAVNPDQAARAQRIGQQVGIGQDVVLRNMAEMEREVVARQAIDRDLMRTAPNLARFLGQREFATIAHDDIDNLTKTERVFKWFAGIPKDVEEGLSRAVATAELGKMYEAQMRGVEPTWLDRVVIQGYNDELRRLSKESGFIESAANIVGIQAEMAAQVPEQVLMGTVMGGAAGLVGGPFAPATVPAMMGIGATAGLTVGMGRAAYILEAGNAYGSMVEEADTVLRQRRDAGEIDAATYESDMREVRDRARTIATGVGVVNAGLELVGLKMIAAPFREAFKGAVRRATAQAVTQQTTRAALGRAGMQYGLAIAGETGTEVMQEIVTVAGEELNSYGADLPLKMSTEEGRAEVAQRLVDTAVETAKGMALVGLPGPVVNYYVNTRKVAEARKAERFFTDLADVSKQDKVAERSPAAYERFLAAQAEGTQAETIYVDARTMQSVLQQARRADPALTDEVIDEAMPGVRQQIDQQVETGGDVTIPTATFGARLARTDLGRSLIPHMRLNPDALSVDEAVRYRGQMEERRQEAMRLMQEQDAAGTSFSQEAETVRDSIRTQIEAAGRSREEADIGSMLYRDFVVIQAARQGITPAEFQAQRGLRGVKGAAVGGGPLEQAAVPAQINAQHREAIKAGDVATAQALTDAAAEERMPDSQVRDADGKIMRVFHGTQRIDRVGNRLLKKRATSGPMPFFTNTRPIAEGYAQGKEDTSIEDIGYEQWIKYKPKGSRSRVTLDQAWLYLTPEQRATATERLFTVGYQNPDEGTGPIVADTDTIASLGHVQYLLREARGNALTAAKELWLNSGSLFNDEQQFMDVLKGMGLTEGFVYDSPHAVNSGIIEAYINITNPLDTAAIPESVVEALQQRANRIRKPAAQYGRDAWDKEVREPQAWMQRLRDDISEGQTQAWTSIPDWVTDVLRRLGYDGIKDTGGKFGGEQHTVWIPFEPEQVKFANAITKDASGRLIPLSERFDLTSPMMYRQEGLLEQAPVTPGFYSALEREVGAIDAKALTASGWNERFKGLISKGAIKADELEWSGLADYLKMQEGKVSKDAVLEFLRGNGVRVERMTLEQARYNRQPLVLLGGTNYREVLLTLPAGFQAPMPAVSPEGLAAREAIFAKYAPRLAELEREGNSLMFAGRALTDEEAQRLADVRNERDELEEQRNAEARAAYKIPERPAAPEFRTGHWDQPNVLVHLRMNDRVDADGKRVLFVEEVQSDWGQQGKKVGFVATEKRRQEIEQEYRDAEAAVAAATPETRQAAQERFKAAMDVYNEELNNRTIARAPFVETTDGWLNLGLKQVLLEAVRGNYDRVAFVNGEQSANRYDLSQQVDSIVYRQTDGGKYDIEAIKDSSVLVTKKSQSADDLESVLGKDVAKRIIDGVGEQPADYPAEYKELAGVNLKVGGEGMKAFYDKIVPIAMGKLLKKYGGGKLGQVAMATERRVTNDEIMAAERRGDFAEAERLTAIMERQELGRGEAQAGEAVIGDQPGFDITPEMVKKFESGLPLFQAMPQRGEARGGFDPKRLTVLLNKQADLSTFLHELSHYFLTTYSDIAASGKASPELLADLDTTLQWFGIAGDTPQARLSAWNAMSLDQQRPFHEQFAYSFEVYAFDGKAPSAELRGVFERFSSYLKRVYKSIRDELNAIYRREFGKDLPILTGEVRQVMDRMLASDAAIRRQQAVESIKPAFLTREQAGVDEAQWAEHQAALADAEAIAINDMTKASLRTVQWLSNARSRIVKEMQSKHDAKRKEVRDEVAAQVRMEPAYRAQAYLRYGKFIDADGQEVEVDGPHKLDLDTVKKMYELEPDALRPDITAMARGKYGFVGKDGLNPDMIAETFGYSSGDQMIRAVMDLKPIKEAIDERTDQVMEHRFSDLNSKAAVDAEVQKALHNEARARFVAIELKFAAKATEPTRVIVEAARQAARDMIAAKKVRDVRPSEHVAAEARASKDAVMLAGKTEIPESMKVRYPTGTVDEALIRAKRQEMYQNQLAAEALRVKDEVDKDVKYLRRILRDENVKRMGADATDQVAELLSRFDVAAVPLKILDRRKQTLAAWMEAKADGGIVPDIAPELLEAGRRVNYREMTVAEFRDLVSAVKQIEYVGKNERKLQLAEERAEFEEKRDEIVTRIRATGRLRGLDIDPRSPLTNIGRTVSKLQAFAAAHLKAASIARVLDGGKDDGPLWNTVIRTANAAADMETRMRSEATAKLAEILKPVFALGNMGGKGMFFQSINRSLNREARIAIALNMGNAGNMQRLLDGEGWNMAQVQPILESLTAAEWNAVQQVWDFLETYRPLVAAKERRLYGKEPNWVEPQPLTVRTSDGQTLILRGGYYPVKYDPVASDRVATFDEVQEAKDALRGTYTAATTRRSFTKARAEKVVGRPILYTLDAAFSGVNDVIHDLAWHEWLISTNRLLRDEKFANAVRETRGPEFLRQLREWAKANAAGDRPANVEGALSWLRQGISASGLGFNVMSAALQITGFNQSVVRVGAKWVGLGIAEFTASPLVTSQFVREKSSFMAERQRTQFRELNELRNTVRGKGAGVSKVLAQAYVAMMTMQRAVDTPTWVAAYRKALAGGKDDATAVALADQAVKDSQGSGLTADLAAIERGGPGLKLFTVFYSYMNTVYNMAAVQTYTARGRGKLAADYVMLIVVPVVLGHAIKSLLTPDAGDDDFDPEALARKLAAEELSFLMGTMVVAREFGGAAQLLTGAEGARMGYGGPAGVRAIGEAYNLATQTGQMEFDRAFVRSAINTLGAFTGLPSAQINRTIDGVEAILEGEVEGVGAVVAPLTGVKK